MGRITLILIEWGPMPVPVIIDNTTIDNGLFVRMSSGYYIKEVTYLQT